jgi:hypothetical protein
VQEIDGAPSVANVTTLRVANGDLVDEGNGVARLRTATDAQVTGSWDLIHLSDPGTGANHEITSATLLPLNTVSITLMRDSRMMIEYSLYAASVEVRTHDVFIAISPDNGTTWWVYDMLELTDLPAGFTQKPAGHYGRRTRDLSAGAGFHTYVAAVAQGVFATGTYLIRMRTSTLTTSTNKLTLGGRNHMVRVWAHGA